ncbi:peptide ABC transporter permease [Spirochaetia bacterium]|nr:peptide ABC transporter permease [Spirochaetia bacterium]
MIQLKIGRKKQFSDLSQMGLVWYRFKKNKLAMLGLFIIIFYLLISFAAPLFVDYATVITQSIPNRFKSPSAEHWFGTDQYGRDLFARVVWGGQVSLLAGLASVIISLFFGVILGGIAGYAGGRAENLIMRALDILMAVPSMLLTMAIVAALGQGIQNMLVALSISAIPAYARVIRSSILSIRNLEYVESAKCSGATSWRIIFKHILPNCIGPIIVNATLSLGSVILSIANLGFLGVGISPPTPEWGTILSENRANIRFYPYMGIIPGVAIAVAVMALNFIGDGLRDAFDPRTKS